jgi:hypothetical protein
VLNVGREVRSHRAWVAVTASGWCARVATSASGVDALPPAHVPANELAALAAACLGSGQVFLALVGRPLLAGPLELSLFDLTTGAPGDLDVGPALPPSIELDAFVVGCGGVTNWFAYASARTTLTGRVEAVDKQSLRPENMGPYVCATQARLGIPKAEVIRDVLMSALSRMCSVGTEARRARYGAVYGAFASRRHLGFVCFGNGPFARQSG